MKKGALSSTFERDVCPIRQIAPWEAPGSHLKAAPKCMSALECAPSLAATLRNPFLLDFRSSWTKIVRYVSRLTTRKKATRQAVCCELGFLIRADWEKLAGSHPDSHIAVLCPRRRFFREIALVDRFRFITHQMSQPHREQTSRDEADPEARPQGRTNSAVRPQSPPPPSYGKRKSGHEARFLLVTPDRVAIPYSQ